jgi:hypothetical protein
MGVAMNTSRSSWAVNESHSPPPVRRTRARGHRRGRKVGFVIEADGDTTRVGPSLDPSVERPVRSNGAGSGKVRRE